MAFQGLPLLFPRAIFRMVRLTIMHGASNISAYAFASYGVFFCSNFDFEEGYKMGKIAKAMMQRFDSNEVS